MEENKNIWKGFVMTTLTQLLGTFLVVTVVFAIALRLAVRSDCFGRNCATIAAAAILNEIIAVIAAKKGFEWAGEILG